MDSSVSLKDQIWFLRVCHHISNVLYLFNASGSCMEEGEVWLHAFFISYVAEVSV